MPGALTSDSDSNSSGVLGALADTVNPYIAPLGISMKGSLEDWRDANSRSLMNILASIPGLAGFASPADYHDPSTAASKNAQATIGWLPGALHSNMPPDASPQMAGTTRLISPPSASPPLPDNVMATFAGTNSKTADYDKLAKAQDMHAAGSSPDETRQATGWFLHPADNQWRYEIPDNKARLTALGRSYFDNPNKAQEATLGQLWSHGDLYQAYPSLRDVPVRAGEGDYLGGYSPWENAFSVNYGRHDLDYLPQDTLTHEPQHAIQHYEGFAGGANVHDFLTASEQQAARRSSVLGNPLSPELEAAVNRAEQQYWEAPGEIEARAAADRRLLSPQQRLKRSPLAKENQ